MYSFMNDYSEGAHEKILQKLIKCNLEQNIGYGEDKHSKKAKEYIKRYIKNKEVDIHFIPGGTQTNLITISSFLRPHEAVIAAHTGHINVHETGAIEATGHKVIAMASKDGKLSIESIKQALNHHSDEHMVKPKMVYISNTTELGTIYTKNELKEIHNICDENNLILFLDGARLGSALTSKENDLDLNEIASLVDVFYIGGTKNGALLGEALVITNDKLKEDFRYLIKQKGALMAKGFVAGIQFETLFEDDLFFSLAKHANKMSEKISDSLQRLGYKFYVPPMTNQIFPVLSNDILDKLSKEFLYSIEAKVDENNSAIRFVTSWATTEESVNKLISFFKNLK